MNASRSFAGYALLCFSSCSFLGLAYYFCSDLFLRPSIAQDLISAHDPRQSVASHSLTELEGWQLNTDGQLIIQTVRNANIQVFYETSSGSVGARLWLDFAGEPIRTTRLVGTADIRMIRIGKPAKNMTRLVLEFQPGVEIPAGKLRLVGTSPVQWRLDLGPSVRIERSIGGNLYATRSSEYSPETESRDTPSAIPLKASRSNWKALGACQYEWSAWKLSPHGVRTTAFRCSSRSQGYVAVDCRTQSINFFQLGDGWAGWKTPQSSQDSGSELVSSLCSDLL
jgi:hypothetical protein